MVQLGLDFGHATLKVAGIEHGLFGRRVIGLGEVPIPSGSITQAGLTQTKALTTALGQALAEAKPHALAGHQVISALPAGVILTKLLELPAMSRDELKRTIPFEAGQAFPVAMEDLIIDWLVLPRRPARKMAMSTKNPEATPANETMDVLLLGAPKRLVESMIDFCQSLKLELTALEIKPFANARAIIQPGDKDRQLVLDIGAIDTSLAITDRGLIRHISTIDFGAENLQEKIPGPPPMPEKESVSTTKTRSKSTKKELTPIGTTDLTTKLGPLSEEIDHLIKYYFHRVDETSAIRHIHLTGGGSKIPGITEALKSVTGLTVKLANPLLNTTGHKNVDPVAYATFTTAIGLALRTDKTSRF